MARLSFLVLLFPKFLFAIFSGNVAEGAILEKGLFIPDSSYVNARAGFNFQISEEVFQFKPALRDSGFSSIRLKSVSPTFMVILNFKEWLDIYGACGLKNPSLYFSRFQNRYSLKLRETPIFVGGGKAVVFEIKRLSLGGDFKYFYFSSGAGSLSRNESSIIHEHCHSKGKGWQLSIGLAYKLALFEPYAGLSVNRWKLQNRLPSLYVKPILSAHEKHRFSPYFGTAITKGEIFFFNIEGRLISERSVVFSSDIRF